MLDTELFPVQVLYLQAPKKVHIQDVFSVILKDLTVRRVLKVQKLSSFPNNRSKKTQKYAMLYKGELYETYEPQPFEKAIITPLADIPQVQTKILTNFVLKKYSYPSAFISDQILKPLKKEGFVSSFLGRVKSTSKAKPLVDQAHEFMNGQKEKLSNLLNGDVQDFIQAVTETGSFLFLFEHHEAEFFNDVARKIKNIKKSYGSNAFPLSPFAEALDLDLSYLHE